MRKLLLLACVAVLPGCSSNGDGTSQTPAEKVVDTVLAPMEIKRVPKAAKEDDGDEGEDVRVPKVAVKVKFVTMSVDTAAPGMPVSVDGQPVGKSRDAGNGRGRLRVRVTPGDHVVQSGGVERRVFAKEDAGAVEVEIPPLAGDGGPEGDPK